MDDRLLSSAPKTYTASTSHPPQGKGYLANYFYVHGVCIARNPILAMVISALVVGSMALGLTMLVISSNPQTIWVPPGSTTSHQQTFFDNAFDPFYRVEQVIFTPKHVTDPSSILANNVLTPGFVAAVQSFQSLVAEAVDSAGTKLDDICFKPIKGKGCIVESVTNFAADNETVINATTEAGLQSMLLCHPPAPMKDGVTLSTTACMSAIGTPAMPSVVLGASECSGDVPGAFNVSVCSGACSGRAAQALMTTWLLNAGPDVAAKAAVWEKEVFLPLARGFDHPELSVTFMAQRSVQDEIAEVAKQNTFVVFVSYIAMFCYIVVAMGKFPHPVRSRSLLGAAGITLVGLSVAGAMGIWAFGGGKITMIVSEVVPFLILAIGVDNMFIVTKTADRIRARRIAAATAARRGRALDSGTPMTITSPEAATPMPEAASGFVPVERLMGDVLAEVGPSITAAATAEALAFFMGTGTSIPALRQFCAVAAIAVAIDYIMQMTWFVAAVTLDFHRQDAELIDCCPCVGAACCKRPERGPLVAGAAGGWCGSGSAEATVAGRVDRKAAGATWYCVHRGEYVRSVLAKYLAPVILSGPVRVVSILVWLGFLTLSGYAALQMKLGLAQQLAVPADSYMFAYFNQQAALGEAGPPAYVVLQNVNYSDATDTAKTSLQNLATQLSTMTEHIVPPVYNWYGDFRSWSSIQNIEQMSIDGSFTPKFGCPVPLMPGNFSIGERVEQFLFDIPIDSNCCQKKAHCYAQYGMDVKLLWVVNKTAALHAAAVTSLASSATPSAPVALSAARQAFPDAHRAAVRAERLARASGRAAFLQEATSSGSSDPREAPWAKEWWASSRWQPATADFPGTPAAPPGSDLVGVVAGSRAEAVAMLMAGLPESPRALPPVDPETGDWTEADAARGPSPAVRAASEAAEAWRIASAVPGASASSRLLRAAELHTKALAQHGGSALTVTALGVAAALAPTTVMTSRMRTLHTALRDQTAFVTAMQATQGAVHRLTPGIPMADPAALAPPGTPINSMSPGRPGNVTDNEHTAWLEAAPAGPNREVEAAFPYSLFYVYYEQYDYIRGVAITSVLTSLGAAFIAVLVVTSPSVALFVALMVGTVAVDIIGIVWLLNPAGEGQALSKLSGVGGEVFGVEINAVSVVNLVTAVGLAVEFNVHIASHFASSSGTRIVRAHKALSEMGSAVITGITLTKLVGVLVLGWAPSQIFRLYYFRMYMAIIIAGAFHGLVVLPALLTFFGPASIHRIDYVKDNETGELRPREHEEYRGALEDTLHVPRDDDSIASSESARSDRDLDFGGPADEPYRPAYETSPTKTGSLQSY